MTAPTSDERYAANVALIFSKKAKDHRKFAKLYERKAQEIRDHLAHLRTTPRCLRENDR